MWLHLDQIRNMTGGHALLRLGLVALLLASPVIGQERLSLEEGRQLATSLISNGQPWAAREIALALLQANPRDLDALILLSRAERALGNTEDALDAGRRAWSVAETDVDRFVVASVMAQAHSTAAQFTRAQFWLRRAAEAAPNDQMEAFAARDYGVLRHANPLSFKLSFSVLPSNNINNGNSNNKLTFAYLPGALASLEWEVPAASRPLSGLALTGQVELSYRLARSERSQTNLNLDLFAQGYVLSAESKRTAPGVTAESLGYQQISLGLSHSWLAEGASGPFSAEFTLSQSIYGGNPHTRDAALSLARQWKLENGQVYSALVSVNQTTYLADQSRANGVAVRGAWQQSLGNADVLGLSIGASKVISDRPDRGFGAVSAQVSYDFGTVGKGLDLSLAGAVEKRVYVASNLDPAGRSDLRTSVQVDLGLPDLAIYGFAPVASLSANRTNSTVPFFDTEAVRLGFQVKSTF
jgi:hypothetical protein